MFTSSIDTQLRVLRVISTTKNSKIICVKSKNCKIVGRI